MRLIQVFYPYTEWEDFKYGMYKKISKSKEEDYVNKAVKFMSNTTKFVNRGFWIVFVLYVVLMLCDLGSTLLVGESVYQHLEANPLFGLIGMWGIVLLNIGITLLVYFGYNSQKSNVFSRYALITFLVTITLVRIFVVQNNFQYVVNPLTPMEAQQYVEVTNPGAKSEMVGLLSLLCYLPLAVSYITYLFFKQDHNITKKEKGTVII